jgi:quercetin dioxygenase-like cupin family protein
MMFYKRNNSGYRVLTEGVQRKTLVHGQKTLLCEFRIGGGGLVPFHNHPYEQTGYLVSGHMELIIGDERFDVEPGDSWCIPGDVEHGGEVFEDSVVVEVFSHVREDYLP